MREEIKPSSNSEIPSENASVEEFNTQHIFVHSQCSVIRPCLVLDVLCRSGGVKCLLVGLMASSRKWPQEDREVLTMA